MRAQLVKTVLETMKNDERVVLLLGDIGVYGFREAFKQFPKRVYNIGILEQASISLAAGLAIEGMIPVFHTIAPFMVERALEQLKVDFGYQGLGGNFISIGGSYDYSQLGCTHHCPGDVQALKTIPGMRVAVPGHSREFDAAFKTVYANGKPTYFRLSERSNADCHMNGILRAGTQGTVVVFGPMLDRVLEACVDLNVAVIYHTWAAEFNPAWLQNVSKKIVVVEPFYEGTMSYDIQKAVGQAEIHSIGVPRKFLTSYGTIEEQDEACGLTADNIRARIKEHINV
jgi:transketolase